MSTHDCKSVPHITAPTGLDMPNFTCECMRHIVVSSEYTRRNPFVCQCGRIYYNEDGNAYEMSTDQLRDLVDDRPDTILDEAKDAVYGNRNDEYGDPDINHWRTAVMFKAYIEAQFGVELDLTAVDVCQFNQLQKMSRMMNHHDTPETMPRDMSRDQSGYAQNVAIIAGHDPRPSDVRGDGE